VATAGASGDAGQGRDEVHDPKQVGLQDVPKRRELEGLVIVDGIDTGVQDEHVGRRARPFESRDQLRHVVS